MDTRFPTINLGATKKIAEISLGCLQDNNSWIFFPTGVEFSFSVDGVDFGNTIEIKNDVSPKEPAVLVKDFKADLDRAVRFIRVRARNLGQCPPWHKGAGGKAWLFVDEISIKTDRTER